MTNTSLIFLVLAIVSAVHAKPPQQIVGGERANLGQIPYIVSFARYGRHFCGGSIISDRHILTAAHCVFSSTKSGHGNIDIRTGATSSLNGGKVYKIAKVVCHPRYDDAKSGPPNDLALITVQGTIAFDKNTKKIDLLDREATSDANVVASGWGLRTSKDRSTPNDLYTVKLKVAKTDACQKSFPSVRLQSTQVCAIGPVGQGVCMGDSGGPLALDGKLAGVVSFGRPCGLGHSDVFTSVYHFRDWVQAEMAKR